MIRTVAELLLEMVNRALPDLAKHDVRHAPTIGAMYEGLSTDIVGRAIPDGLGLRVVSGFVTDDHGTQSGQLDLMVVRGEGTQIPFTNSHVWHIKDVIAVIEVKKTLRAAEMAEAWQQLAEVKAVEQSYREIATVGEPGVTVDICSARRTFAAMTGRALPSYHQIGQLSQADQMIFHSLVNEHHSTVRVLWGLQGYSSESALRRGLRGFLEPRIGEGSYGMEAFPQLIISGSYSLAKANGLPYTTPLVNDAWPFYVSTPVNPLRILLEFIWTRLEMLYGIDGLWGDDLQVESMRAVLLARPTELHGRRGWHYKFVAATRAQLAAVPDEEAWSPAYLTMQEFLVIQRLCAGRSVSLDDPDLLKFLREESVEPADLRRGLLGTGLVALNGNSFVLTTTACGYAVLPTGEYVAAENSTGRLFRWIERRQQKTSSAADV